MEVPQNFAILLLNTIAASYLYEPEKLSSLIDELDDIVKQDFSIDSAHEFIRKLYNIEVVTPHYVDRFYERFIYNPPLDEKPLVDDSGRINITVLLHERERK